MQATAVPEASPAPPIGTITEVHGPVVVIACRPLPPLHQALRAFLDHESYLFEVHQHLDEQRIRAITLHSTAGLKSGGKRGHGGKRGPAESGVRSIIDAHSVPCVTIARPLRIEFLDALYHDTSRGNWHVHSG